MSSSRNYLCSAALFGFVGVAMGAFGAHALRDTLDSTMMSVYKTGVDYQMWHALALAMIAMLMRSDTESRFLLWSARLMFSGILLFSGSLYLLSVSGIRWFGIITPLGGIAFLAAWGLVVLYSYKSFNQD